MNEQAIQDAYNLFVSQGYRKSIEEFRSLISQNEQALQDVYGLFVDQGYRKSKDDFATLMGLREQPKPKVEEPVKKKRWFGIAIGGWFIGVCRIR